MIRVDGRARFLDCTPPDDELMAEYVKELVSDNEKWDALEHKGSSVDVAFAVPESRTRASAPAFFHTAAQKYAVVMRRIITKSPMFDDLGLPPMVEKLADYHRGIVVVSGTTGSGKTTTLAAIIGKINRTRAERIITVEDPIEYQHENAKSLVSQVEVGTDSESYEYALRAMMRSGPPIRSSSAKFATSSPCPPPLKPPTPATSSSPPSTPPTHPRAFSVSSRSSIPTRVISSSSNLP